MHKKTDLNIKIRLQNCLAEVILINLTILAHLNTVYNNDQPLAWTEKPSDEHVHEIHCYKR
jgi:hypothetical protein